MKKEFQMLKKGVCPKVKSPKMGLPITPRQFSKRPTPFAIFGPARGQIFGKNVNKNIQNYGFSPFGGWLPLFELRKQMDWKGLAAVAPPTKWINLYPKSLKSGFQLFGCLEIRCFPAGGQCQPARQ